MSAFVCEDAVFDALATYAFERRKGLVPACSGKTMDEVAELLRKENIRSVNYRYHGNDDYDDEGYVFVPYDLYGSGMEHAEAITQLIKACQCLDYQSCETPDWRETEACKILDGIMKCLIRDLPDYEDALWGMPQNPARRQPRRSTARNARGAKALCA